MKNILIVCTANKARSVMAMEIANFLARKAGKSDELYFDSAGIAVMGSESDPVVKRILADMGIESAHNPTHFSYLDLNDFDEIHVMTKRQKTALLKLGSHNKNAETERKIRVLNISDPFGKGEDEYRGCLERLRDFYENFISRHD
ncbi:MAG: hypothetical protein LBC82_04970 [Oscillospiraceae bacterium]|jgi:protein-tyrosine-phosphatase|nr:hypothetical protein [Oscillospiraceae bacterium]